MAGEIRKIINDLKSTTKRNEKIAILEANRDNYLLKECIRLAYDPNIRFWIKKIPVERTYVANINHLSMDIVLFSELGRIYNREVTGHAAIDLLIHLLSVTSKDDSEVIEFIIKKDLDCGVSVATINKVWPKLIPEFKDIMKCHDSIEHIVYPAIAQVKCDGSRCILECLNEEGDYIAYSSGGNPIDLGYHFKNYVKLFMNAGEKFDGELVVFDHNGNPIDRKTSNGFINKAIKGTISVIAQSSIRFIAWDIVDYTSSIDYTDRFKDLEGRFNNPEIVGTAQTPRFELVESCVVNSEAEAIDFYKTQLNKGLEGAIIKNLTGKWQPKRVKHQGKMKDELECDITIVGWEPHIKDSSMLGSFILSAFDSNGREMFFNVGSGIDDNMRSQDPSDFIGKVATVRFNKIVRNKKNPENFTLYIPRIIEIRHDKNEGDSVESILSLEQAQAKVEEKRGLF